MHGNRRLIGFTAATIFMTGIFATGALAALVSSSSTQLLRIDNRSNNVTQGTSSNTFVDLTGASVRVVVPTGGRLIRARLTAESRCDATPGNTCSVRIVAFNTTTLAILELNPQAGTDFIFDTAGGDVTEAHAMERSRRLVPGSYDIKVQFAVTGIMTGITLDDWHFTVETFQ